MSVLSLHQVTVRYQQNTVIDQLDLNIDEGEIVALFGPSGGGKSTILKAIAGLLDEVTGDIQLGGVAVLQKGYKVPAELRHTGLIFQDYALFPHLTVAENIAFGLTKLSREQRARKVQHMLGLVKMAEYAGRYPHELSGGQQQRIAIVRALACEPKILLFDEAFSNIDPQFRFELIADIRGLLKAQNTAALFVTHNQDEAFAFSDRIAVLNQGKIEQIDEAAQLFKRPATRFVAEFLGPGVWLDAKVTGPNRVQTQFGQIEYLGAKVLPEAKSEPGQVYLRPHQLSLVPNASSELVVHKERFVGECFEATLTIGDRDITVKTDVSLLQQAVEVKIKTRLESIFFD